MARPPCPNPGHVDCHGPTGYAHSTALLRAQSIHLRQHLLATGATRSHTVTPVLCEPCSGQGCTYERDRTRHTAGAFALPKRDLFASTPALYATDGLHFEGSSSTPTSLPMLVRPSG